MIFSLNARDSVLLPVIKNSFGLNEKDIYNEINLEFNKLIDILQKKNIEYNLLKKALIPNQEKNRYEVCLVFDTAKIDNLWYGNNVFSELIPLLDKKSTYSILFGDYINILNHKDGEVFLRKWLFNNLELVNTSKFISSDQYFLVYINNITQKHFADIVLGLEKFKYFTGFIDVSHNFIFKSYLSHILSMFCIKQANLVIMPHITELEDTANINESGYPFCENGFKICSVNMKLFSLFLSYKIENIVLDKDDIGFSLNAIYPKFNSLDEMKFCIDYGKMKYIKDVEYGKGGILKSLGLIDIPDNKLKNIIFNEILTNYIYNLTYDSKYNVFKFNVCILLRTINNNYRKTVIALKYIPEIKEIHLITIT